MNAGLTTADPYLPGDASFIADPYPYYDRLRADEPVHWSEALDGWVLSRYADVAAVLRDPRMSSRRMAVVFAHATRDDDLRRIMHDRASTQMISSDPPDHTRLRGLVSRSFTPRRVEAMRATMQMVTDGLLDRIADGGSVDILAEFAFPLPMTIISDIVGIPRADGAMVKAWADDIVGFMGADGPDEARTRRYVDSWDSLSRYFHGLAQDRSREHGDDVVSQLVDRRDAGDASEEEVLSNLVLLAVAGHETTTNTIANGLLALLRHPAQLARLRAAPALLENAVEEILRYDAISQRNIRIATEDIDVGTRTIRAGQMAILLLGAANRDPAQFERPNELDIGRTPNRHLTFSYGIHFCLGAELARSEIQVALGSLVRRFASIELDVEPAWKDNVRMRGLISLPVVLQLA